MKKSHSVLTAQLFFFLIFSLPVNYLSVLAQTPEETFSGGKIEIKFNHTGISGIISPSDTYQANIVSRQGAWGRAEISYRVGSGAWLDISTANTRIERVSPDRLVYSNKNEGTVLSLVRSFERNGNSIDCKIRVENRIPYPVILGDFILPFPAASPRSFSGPPEIFERGYIMHRYIAGDASFLYFTRASGEPPYLIVTANPGTRFEYFEGDDIYVHSSLSAGKINEGTWRLDNTSLELAPSNSEGSTVEYGYRLEWADNYDELRNIIYKNGLIDVRVIPGMTVPQDLTARFALHTKIDIDSVVAEHPEETTVDFLGKEKGDYYIYEVDFNRLGENMLTIHHHGEKATVLEFFSTEPVDTLINKRSRFITSSQQHRDNSKWYNGLYSVWDMENSVLRGPDNTDGFDHWWGYVLAADDPGLCKAPFVAAKNVYYPDDNEIASIEYYIRNFVWGGLQRTDKEDPYPYGIYGVPNWKVNRDGLQSKAGIRNRHLEKMPVWRAYDYPHIFMLYFHMFQIADYYPDKVSFRNAEGYLDLAYNTARAYFTYPYEILPYYETYQWGYYNELVLLPLMDELEKHGRKEDAAWLRAEWEKKVKYFVYDDPYPYRSEYAFDRTAFESSYALAKYGTLTEMQPDENLWYDVNKNRWYSHPQVNREDSREFMERQHYAGLAVRGWLEPAYYHYGSDFSLSYMARMGGWSILDYGLAFADEPWDWLQLGYASYLSSFALMNTGTAESNYGYWFPGKKNDGATGWAYNNKKYGSIWLQGRDNPRGAWTYDGEADLGNGAIFRMAATILAKDPLFGWYAYGGTMSYSNSLFSIIPKDGVRNRFWIIDQKQKTGIELLRDGFLKDNPIIYSKKEGTISLNIENRSDSNHETILLIKSGAQWEVFIDGKKIPSQPAIRASERVTEAVLPVTSKKHEIILKKI
jgi:hypothetical protein